MTRRDRVTGDKCSNCSRFFSTTGRQDEEEEGRDPRTVTTTVVASNNSSFEYNCKDKSGRNLEEEEKEETRSRSEQEIVVLELKPGERKTVNLAGALTEIFHLQWSSPPADCWTSSRSNLVLCDPCLKSFSQVCKYFYQFQLLGKFDSFLTESGRKWEELVGSFSVESSRRSNIVTTSREIQLLGQAEIVGLDQVPLVQACQLEELPQFVPQQEKEEQEEQQQQQYSMEGHNFRVHENAPHVQISTNPPTFINPFPHFLTTAETYTTQPTTVDGKAVATYQIGFQACPPQGGSQNFDGASHRFATIDLHTPQPAAYVTATQQNQTTNQPNTSYGWEKTGNSTNNEADRPEYLENSISKCPDCNAEFSSTIALGLHRFRAHNYNRKYTCKTCKKGFANARNLKQHMLRHLNIRPFKCHCESTFKTKPDLQAHQRLVHSVEDRQRIKERIKRTSNWRKAGAQGAGGTRTPPEPEEYRCVDCGQVYSTPNALGDHRIKIHQTQQVYKCHYCGECFGHARSLKVHMSRHTAVRSVAVEAPRPPPQRKKNYTKNTPAPAQDNRMQIQVPSYGQPAPVNYQQPQKVMKPTSTQTQSYGFNVSGSMDTWNTEPTKPSKRSGNYIPKCYHCNIEFESAISLGLHRFRFHNTGRKNICEICNKGFANARNLKDHMFRHLNIRPFKCESCELSFKTKQDLSNHNLYLHSAESQGRRQQMAERRSLLLTGEGGQPQQQQQQQQVDTSACNSPSSENTVGSNVSSTDNQQMPKINEGLIFKCTDCQEEFTSAPNLGDHRAQVHHAADLFKCHVCAKSFVNGNGLKEHMKRHTEARNFRCELCGSGFKVKLDLKQHHYLVHTEDGRRRLHENYARSRAKKQQQQAQKEAADAAALLEVTWSDDDNTSEINVEDHNEASAQRV